MTDFICASCAYPSRSATGCDNPGCVDCETHSPAWRETLRARYAAEAARRAADEAARSSRVALRRRGFTTAF